MISSDPNRFLDAVLGIIWEVFLGGIVDNTVLEQGALDNTWLDSQEYGVGLQLETVITVFIIELIRPLQVELVNIGGTDIVDGNHKLTLGLLWSIILHWQVKDVMKNIMSDLQQTNSEKILLSWVRQSTRPYSPVNVLNFTTSWADGLAFNAVIHRHK
ncbi:hypothetical protein llap_21792 [Limosa lapponica baueri]|uniref:Calponin-homology (CH) domain-containing protein n=1 Tax=Limosa lapponica baueri TaxID=1758121 RepID=A0A2I0T2A0_LIMLA|nr:hypothetical protein llap_21792 [Limosa lapponica baueri]